MVATKVKDDDFICIFYGGHLVVAAEHTVGHTNHLAILICHDEHLSGFFR